MFKRYFAVIILIVMSAFFVVSCGTKDEMNIEDEVSKALIEGGVTVESLDDLEPATTETETLKEAEEETEAANDNNTAVSDATENAKTVNQSAGTAGTGNKPSSDKKTGDVETKEENKKESEPDGRTVNLFLGNTSTSTDFNIKFEVATDSGFAGIAWGGTKEHAGRAPVNTDVTDDANLDEYYVVSFDCTREIPRLYTFRYKDGYIFDEQYTNIDFMFPEMSMFTSVQHIVEIKVSGMTATTYLDSYKIADTALNSPKPCGLIGTYVMNGNYHEYIDNLFVAEGYEGDGEWIYSDDFAGKANLFSPELRTSKGRLYVRSGYYTVPSKSK